MVGTIEPRKNHAAVLRIARRMASSRVPIVIVGRPGWGTDAEVQTLRRLHGEGIVVWLDDFADDELPGLYASSRGVLYPSWTEGFGLPVLEALAAGKPVVTGNDPVFREIGGDHVVQIDPADDQALLNAVAMLAAIPYDDAAASARRARAAHFGWERSATMLVEFIRDIEEFHR
jgi:alpha-1,3-rhamnosyl/mannosyltransferase